jgi:hypothetical protein
MGREDGEMIETARANAERVLTELKGVTRELAEPWPRVTPKALAEGREAAGRAAAAVGELLGRLRHPSGADPSATQ